MLAWAGAFLLSIVGVVILILACWPSRLFRVCQMAAVRPGGPLMFGVFFVAAGIRSVSPSWRDSCTKWATCLTHSAASSARCGFHLFGVADPRSITAAVFFFRRPPIDEELPVGGLDVARGAGHDLPLHACAHDPRPPGVVSMSVHLQRTAQTHLRPTNRGSRRTAPIGAVEGACQSTGQPLSSPARNQPSWWIRTASAQTPLMNLIDLTRGSGCPAGESHVLGHQARRPERRCRAVGYCAQF